MKITDLITKECIRVPLKATDKLAAIAELVDVLNDNGLLTDRDAVLSAVLAREETRSTGIGHGLAVPHGKTQSCPALAMAVGKADPPIDFGGPDGKPCNAVVLLASPLDKTGPHIQALASISRLWLGEGFRAAVEQATTADDLYAAIQSHQG
jgi:mannitol/fructose-specific phosphotransferase system IIA component (Ntr-type)